jgi:hypothetical protein
MMMRNAMSFKGDILCLKPAQLELVGSFQDLHQRCIPGMTKSVWTINAAAVLHLPIFQLSSLPSIPRYSVIHLPLHRIRMYERIGFHRELSFIDRFEFFELLLEALNR